MVDRNYWPYGKLQPGETKPPQAYSASLLLYYRIAGGSLTMVLRARYFGKMSTKDTRRQDRLRYRSSRVTSLNLRSYNSNKPPSHMASSGGKHRRYPWDEPFACSYLAGLSQSWELAGKGFRWM